MRARPISRLLGALTACGAVVCFVAVACEPQEIYLFDEASSGLEEADDAGADEPEPAPSAPPSEPDDTEPPPPEREQPQCLSDECEQCVARGDCSVQATLFCHPVTGECELPCDPEISEQRACPATDQCDPVTELCVECVESDNCTSGPRRVCNLARGQCVECVTADDCPGTRPICDPQARCVECIDSGDCGPGLLCQPGAQRCVQCIENSDCRFSDDDVFCLPGAQRCVECLVDADCTEDRSKPFCSSENDCEDERE